MSKFAYKFSNLCGAVYRQGNVAFTSDGDSVLSPVGNRISQFDLKNNKSCTFPFENRKNISRFAVSPDGLIMITVDEDGRALLVNLYRKVVLHHFNFKQPVHDIKYSPNGRYFAVTHGRGVQVWDAPGHSRDFAPFSLYRSFPSQYDETLCIDWSSDSNFFAVGARDMSCRVFSLHSIPGFHYVTLAAHRTALVACFFEHNSLNVYSVAKDGALVVWECSMTLTEMQEYIRTVRGSRRGAREQSDRQENREPTSKEKGRERDLGRDSEKDSEIAEDGSSSKNESSSSGEESEGEAEEESGVAMETVAMVIRSGGQGSSSSEDEADELQEPTAKKPKRVNICHWTKAAKHLFPQEHGRVTCATMHKPSHLLIVGFNTGVFALYELPEFNPIHTLSISQQKITSVAVNCTGEWLAFGCRSLGQLLVWEWQSETYVLKQQGHYYDMNTLAYSPDGQIIATGGDDGKVKLWNTASGFCFVTFSDHSSPVTMVTFNASGKVVVSSSLDGTVRAFDLHRYRNFRTFASPRPVQFSCLALDPSGEVVCAGSQDSFEIFVWSMQTGRLLELLTGHEGPVSSLVFCPSRAVLVSGSWDKTVKLWDVFEQKGNMETLLHTSDVITLAFRPDGLQLAVATLDGQISFWDVNNAVQVGSIEGRNDLQVGRRAADGVTAKKLAGGACFTSLCYTADGQCVLAGGRSKFVCIYNAPHQILLKKFQTSRNKSFDGMQQFLRSSRMTEAGPLDLISDDEGDRGEDIRLPGVRRGDMSSRRTRPEIRTKCVQFSPTGRAWAAVTTEGLLVYSLDSGVVFDPYDLTIEVTPETITTAMKEKQYTSALVMSFQLNERDIIVKVVEGIPLQDVQLIVQNLPEVYVEKMLQYLAERLDHSPHLEYYLYWSTQLLSTHGRKLKERAPSIMGTIRDLQKSIVQKQLDLGKLCDANTYMLQYALCTAKFSKHDHAMEDPQYMEPQSD